MDITDYIDHIVKALASGDKFNSLSHGVGRLGRVDDALRGIGGSLHIDDVGGITSIKFVGLFASGRDSSGTYAYYFYVAIRINGGHVRVRASISDGQIVRVVEGYEIYRVAQRDVVLLAAVGDACGLQNYGTCLVVCHFGNLNHTIGSYIRVEYQLVVLVSGGRRNGESQVASC